MPTDKRVDAGLEGVFREIFPVEELPTRPSSSNTLHYDLGKPRFPDPDECRQLRLTYGRPLHVWLRLNKGETTLEESVYLGDMPIMISSGEFIINGAPSRRRQPTSPSAPVAVDFVVRDRVRRTSGCMSAAVVIPDAGAGSELQVTQKDTLGVRIDQSGKFSSMTLPFRHEPEVFQR